MGGGVKAHKGGHKRALGTASDSGPGGGPWDSPHIQDTQWPKDRCLDCACVCWVSHVIGTLGAVIGGFG